MEPVSAAKMVSHQNRSAGTAEKGATLLALALLGLEEMIQMEKAMATTVRQQETTI